MNLNAKIRGLLLIQALTERAHHHRVAAEALDKIASYIDRGDGSVDVFHHDNMLQIRGVKSPQYDELLEAVQTIFDAEHKCTSQ